MKQKEAEIEKERENINDAREFMEKKRKETEKNISRISWDAVTSKGGEETSELESLIKNL